MTRVKGGGTVSSYFNMESRKTGDDVYDEGMRFVHGQLEKIHFTDDQSNVSKKFVEYDVSVRDAKGGQTVFKNVRSVSSMFGYNDFDETILEPNDVAFSGKLNPSNFFGNKNGAVVTLAFLDGAKDKPMIMGALDHPKKIGATRADGIRKKGEFRGLAWEINKLGEFSITYNGSRKPDGKLERADTGPTKIKIDKDGVLTITDKEAQKIEMNRKTKTISFSNGITITIDGKNDKFKVLTKGGASIEVDGTADSITLKDKGNGELKISNNKVALGASSAELLQQISDQLDKIATWANSVGAVHTHIGNLGYPTLVPDQASGYTSLGSDLNTIKGKVDGIKGTL